MKRHPKDAGLHAVARVRGVREQDSRAGLLQANRELQAAKEALEALELRLVAPAATNTPAEAFAAARLALTALSSRISTARDGLDLSRSVADASQARWQLDRTRVQVVDMLLERRAAERAAEANRVEARELDDLATQGWQRRKNQHGARP